MKIAITDLSKYSRCILRNRWVVSTPEEKVRQELLRKMISGLGFPKGLISIEKGIGRRRTDLVCYTREMNPLLLVECKAGELSSMAMRQALGYNAALKAPFISLANSEEIKTFWQEKGKISSVPFLPMFQELYEIFRRL